MRRPMPQVSEMASSATASTLSSANCGVLRRLRSSEPPRVGRAPPAYPPPPLLPEPPAGPLDAELPGEVGMVSLSQSPSPLGGAELAGTGFVSPLQGGALGGSGRAPLVHQLSPSGTA